MEDLRDKCLAVEQDEEVEEGERLGGAERVRVLAENEESA